MARQTEKVEESAPVEVPDAEYLTLKEGAAMARMSYQNFSQAVRPKGDIPFIKVPGYSRKKLVRKSDVRAWMHSES